MTTHDRGPCPVCGDDVALTANGDVHHKHGCAAKGLIEGQGRVRESILIPLPWTTPPISPNDRQHWATKARATAAVKNDARWAIRAAKVPGIESADITLHWRVPDHRRRDSDNLAAIKKVATDALVAEGVLSDDSWQQVPSSTERIHPPLKGMPGCMWLELTNVVHRAPQPA